MAAPPYTVPAAPFVEILSSRVEKLERAGEERPIGVLSAETGLGLRVLHRLLSAGQQNLHFDLADRIVTRLLGPMMWHTDETLREIYLNANLAAVDRRPLPVAA